MKRTIITAGLAALLLAAGPTCGVWAEGGRGGPGRGGPGHGGPGGGMGGPGGRMGGPGGGRGRGRNNRGGPRGGGQERAPRPNARQQLDHLWQGFAAIEASNTPLSQDQAGRVLALVRPWSRSRTMSEANASYIAAQLTAVLTPAQKAMLPQDGPPGMGGPGDGGGRGRQDGPGGQDGPGMGGRGGQGGPGRRGRGGPGGRGGQGGPGMGGPDMGGPGMDFDPFGDDGPPEGGPQGGRGGQGGPGMGGRGRGGRGRGGPGMGGPGGRGGPGRRGGPGGQGGPGMGGPGMGGPGMGGPGMGGPGDFDGDFRFGPPPEGGFGPGMGGPEGNMTSQQMQTVQNFLANLNPFYPPTGYSEWSTLPSEVQQGISRHFREGRVTLEALSRKSRGITR